MHMPDFFHDGSVIFNNCRKIATRTDLACKLKKMSIPLCGFTPMAKPGCNIFTTKTVFYTCSAILKLNK